MAISSHLETVLLHLSLGAIVIANTTVMRKHLTNSGEFALLEEVFFEDGLILSQGMFMLISGLSGF